MSKHTIVLSIRGSITSSVNTVERYRNERLMLPDVLNMGKNAMELQVSACDVKSNRHWVYGYSLNTLHLKDLKNLDD